MCHPFNTFIGKTVESVEQFYLDRYPTSQRWNTGQLYLFRFEDGSQSVIATQVEVGSGFASISVYQSIDEALTNPDGETIAKLYPTMADRMLQPEVSKIESEEEYARTVYFIRQFEKALDEHQSIDRPEEIHPDLWAATESGLRDKLQALVLTAQDYEESLAGGEPICPVCYQFMRPRRIWHRHDVMDAPSGVWLCKECQEAAGSPFVETPDEPISS